jgi:hypothetical protein
MWGSTYQSRPSDSPESIRVRMVGMVQLGRDADFAEKPLGADSCAEVGTQHLQRHVTIVLEIARQVDRRHAATTDLSPHLVAAKAMARAKIPARPCE